jgi:hypothetical protein
MGSIVSILVNRKASQAQNQFVACKFWLGNKVVDTDARQRWISTRAAVRQRLPITELAPVTTELWVAIATVARFVVFINT